MAAEALDGLALEQRLAPVRKGARVLREIAWRLREIGNDGRICDLINSQVAVIEKGAEKISSEEAKAALSAAFAALQGRLVESATMAPCPRRLPRPRRLRAFPAAPEMPPAAVAERTEPAPVQEAAEAPSGSLAPPAEAALAEAEAVLAEAAEAPPVAEFTSEAADVQETCSQDAYAQDASAQDADAQDEAVLDIIAMEMGAPDPISDDEIAEAIAEQARIHEPAPVGRRS